jgi:hypothetical protein
LEPVPLPVNDLYPRSRAGDHHLPEPVPSPLFQPIARLHHVTAQVHPFLSVCFYYCDPKPIFLVFLSRVGISN